MATLRNKRKLAAVSRETPESTRSGRAQNSLDPELTQDYISQVSEEIEGRVTRKLSKEFSRTESRILGALSKLDEFLLNPQVRTCSVAVSGTSGSSNLENQGTNEDRPSDDPGPEVEFSFPHFGAEADPHNKPSLESWPTFEWIWWKSYKKIISQEKTTERTQFLDSCWFSKQFYSTFISSI